MWLSISVIVTTVNDTICHLEQEVISMHLFYYPTIPRLTIYSRKTEMLMLDRTGIFIQQNTTQ